MEFCELNENEFRNFLDCHPLKTFIQTPEMAWVREQSGYSSCYVGVKKNSIIVAASMVGYHKGPFGFREFYAPRGLLVDYEDKTTLAFFTKALKKYISNNHGYVLRIDPYYITEQLDIDGKIVEGGINHKKGINNLKELGYRHSKTVYQQFKLLFSLSLDMTSENLYKNFRTLTKRMIKKAEQSEILIREVSRDELSIVQNLIDETSERKHFQARNISYYQNLYDAFSDKKQVKFMVAEINKNVYQRKIKLEIENIKKQLDKELNNSNKINLENSLNKKLLLFEESQQMPIDDKGNVLLSAGVFILYSDELIYLFGGNKKEYMHIGASYLMQWTMIQYANSHSFQKYNFYGISSPTKDDGVYNFKRGFGGYVEKLIGDYELPIAPIYFLINFIKKIIRH